MCRELASCANVRLNVRPERGRSVYILTSTLKHFDGLYLFGDVSMNYDYVSSFRLLSRCFARTRCRLVRGRGHESADRVTCCMCIVTPRGY